MTRLFAIFLFNTMIANAGVEEYLRNIKPVLKKRCYACHGALKQKAGLRVDSAENLGKGIKGGITNGSTDELGYHAVEAPHYVTDVHATINHLLGIDPHKLEVPGHKRLDMDFGHVIEDIIA